MSDAEIAAAAAALREGPEVMADLRYQFSVLNRVRLNLRRDTAQIDAALVELRRAG